MLCVYRAPSKRVNAKVKFYSLSHTHSRSFRMCMSALCLYLLVPLLLFKRQIVKKTINFQSECHTRNISLLRVFLLFLFVVGWLPLCRRCISAKHRKTTMSKTNVGRNFFPVFSAAFYRKIEAKPINENSSRTYTNIRWKRRTYAAESEVRMLFRNSWWSCKWNDIAWLPRQRSKRADRKGTLARAQGFAPAHQVK